VQTSFRAIGALYGGNQSLYTLRTLYALHILYHINVSSRTTQWQLLAKTIQETASLEYGLPTCISFQTFKRAAINLLAHFGVMGTYSTRNKTEAYKIYTEIGQWPS